jgi:hypothetical protein
MNNKNRSLRLTERDIEYITWIAEQQAVRLDTLQLLFEIKNSKRQLSSQAHNDGEPSNEKHNWLSLLDNRCSISGNPVTHQNA